MRHLSEMRRLLAKPENIGEARAVLAERVGSFTLSPALEWSCAAKGSSGFSSACISLSAFRRRRSTRVGAWTSNCWAGSLRLLPPRDDRREASGNWKPEIYRMGAGRIQHRFLRRYSRKRQSTTNASGPYASLESGVVISLSDDCVASRPNVMSRRGPG